MKRIENAKISGTMLGIEDHGIFTCYVYVEGHAWGCGFGGYAMDQWNAKKKNREGTGYGMEFLKRILNCLEVSEWEKLKGTPVRVETEGVGGRITRIGHYLKDKWFDPEELKDYMEAKTPCQ